MLGRIERGITNPTWKTIRAITTALSIDLHQLANAIEEHEHPHPPHPAPQPATPRHKHHPQPPTRHTPTTAWAATSVTSNTARIAPHFTSR